MSSDQLTREEEAAERAADGGPLTDHEHPFDAWSRCAPIRLAGYEDDPTETHILRGID